MEVPATEISNPAETIPVVRICIKVHRRWRCYTGGGATPFVQSAMTARRPHSRVGLRHLGFRARSPIFAKRRCDYG